MSPARCNCPGTHVLHRQLQAQGLHRGCAGRRTAVPPGPPGPGPGRRRSLLPRRLRLSASKPDGLVTLVQRGRPCDRRGAARRRPGQAGRRRASNGRTPSRTTPTSAWCRRRARTGVPHLEDIIGNIIDVLLKTKALAADPLNGKYHTLFYSQILADMKAAGFHPGKSLNLIPGVARAPPSWNRCAPTKPLARAHRRAVDPSAARRRIARRADLFPARRPPTISDAERARLAGPAPAAAIVPAVLSPRHRPRPGRGRPRGQPAAGPSPRRGRRRSTSIAQGVRPERIRTEAGRPRRASGASWTAKCAKSVRPLIGRSECPTEIGQPS